MNKPIDFSGHTDFIIVSSIDWSEIRQMPQQLAASLVESGCSVLFIENTGVRAPRLGDASRIRARIRNWLKGTRGFCDIQDNLTVYSPIFIPLPYSKIALVFNRFFLSSSIKKWMRSSRFYNPVLITFLPTPLVDLVIKDIDPELVVYYCANDMAGGSVGAAPLRSFENKFFAKVDAVFCNSNSLLEKASEFANKTFLFPAGVDFLKFENARNNMAVPYDLMSIKGPIVGYVGAISSVFDQELVVYAARALPYVNFVLIGPVYTDITFLSSCPNIILMGKRPHDLVPAYIKGFDVALIPYVKNSFTDAVYSCKLNEYLAMGVAVVATDLREFSLYIKQHGHVLSIAVGKEDFVKEVSRSLAPLDEVSIEARIDAARKNSWDNRFEGICRVISELILDNGNRKFDWQSRLTSYYRRSQIRLIKAAVYTIAIYTLIFHTPIVWFSGDQLAVRHKPKLADAIVVFSGDGESSYINQSYQRRALDAIHYYKSGYAPLIILSSGKDQTFSEVEIIRSLLISRGIPDQSIEILKKYPRSTFENVIFVKKMLIVRKVKTILLITSPYHSRRALWTWRKVMPELDVFAPVVVDTPKSNLQWSASVDQIKVICYEYLAIAYYWWKGWL